MFTYKDHRVHVAGISFTIPDGCILNWMHTEVEIEGFSALSPDGKIKICLLPKTYFPRMENLSAYERFDKLMTMFKEGTYIYHTDITPICKYGLDGYSLTHSGETVHYYDEYFDLPEHIDGIYQIHIGITASDGLTMEEALQHPMVREFMESIR